MFNSDNPNLPYPLSTPTNTILADWVFKDFPEPTQQAGFVLQAYHPFALQAFPGIRENPAWADIWQILAGMPDLSVIHLRRDNLLQRHLSHVLARTTGEWHSWDKQRVKAVTHIEDDAIDRAGSNVRRDKVVALDPEQLQTDFAEVENWHNRAEQLLSQHPGISITYEQLRDNLPVTTKKVLDFLKVDSYPLQAAVKKLEKRSLRQAISNYDELKQHFADTGWADFFVD